jgi:Tol biopolymer transport system component
MKIWWPILMVALALAGCQSGQDNKKEQKPGNSYDAAQDTLRYAQESHLRNVRQLTYEGDNAEAYFSFDDEMLVFQRTTRDSVLPCDQIFYGKVPEKGEAFEFEMVSTGKGRTTCAYFYHGNDTIIYASTHLDSDECPEEPDMRNLKKYVWPIYSSYELFLTNKNGDFQTQLTDNDHYDAEATVSPTGNRVVFTSTRSGDLDLWTMNPDGTDLKQITHELGYDGGAFFSPDGSKICWRASRPKDGKEAKEYKDLLDRGLIQPGELELYVANADGSDARRITNIGSANWAPNWHPSGDKLIFASNHQSGGRGFNLFMVDLDGSGLKQITYDDEFDAFPMFSNDGKKLMWSSNRNNGNTRDTNIFIADWVEEPASVEVE